MPESVMLLIGLQRLSANIPTMLPPNSDVEVRMLQPWHPSQHLCQLPTMPSCLESYVLYRHLSTALWRNACIREGTVATGGIGMVKIGYLRKIGLTNTANRQKKRVSSAIRHPVSLKLRLILTPPAQVTALFLTMLWKWLSKNKFLAKKEETRARLWYSAKKV